MLDNIRVLLHYLKPVSSIAKKVFMVFMVFSAVIILFSYFWHSDAPKIASHNITTEKRAELYTLINDKQLNSTKQGQAYISLVRSLMCSVNGEGCTNNPADGDKNIRHSLAGSISNIITLPYNNPPASGVQTAYDTLQHAGLVPQANAAMGVGYAAISPFKEIWTIFRNLVFFLLVVLIVAIGFMVMFRTKINAQTVVSLENSLPKIALTLIFITFSFAIAGFMIDLMYVVMFLTAGLFSQPGITDTTIQSTNKIMGQVLWGKDGGTFGYMFDAQRVRTVATGFYQFIPGAVRAILDQVVGGYGYNLVMKLVGIFFSGPIGPFAPGTAPIRYSIANMGDVLKSVGQILPFVDKTTSTGQPVASFLTGMVTLIAQQVLTTVLAPIVVTIFIGIILMASLLLVFFRIMFMLIKEYIQILIQIMFAPVFILFEIIPGQSGFMNWFKNLFIHLLTFPLLLMVLLVSKVIADAPVGNEALWQPPFIWGFDAESFKYIVGGAFLFMAPEFVNMFKEMTGIKQQDMKLNPGAFFASATIAGKSLATPGKFYNVSKLVENVGGEGGRKAIETLNKNRFIRSMIKRNVTGGAPELSEENKG